MTRIDLGGRVNADPVVLRHPDGHLEVFVVGHDSRLHRKPQQGPDQAFAPDWARFPDELGVFLYREQVHIDPLTARPAVGTEEDRAVVFARTARGRIVYSFHRGDHHAPWSEWKSLSAIQDGHPAIGNPAVVRDPNSSALRLFTRGVGNDLIEKQRSGRGPEDWGDGARWHSHGGVIADDPAVVMVGPNPAQLVVCARGLDGEAWWFGQEVRTENGSTHGAPPKWMRLAAGAPRAKPLGRPIPRNPHRAVLWRGMDGNAWSKDERPGFGNYADRCRDSGTRVASDPAVVLVPGREYQFWVRHDGALIMARFQNGAWEPVQVLDRDVLGTPSATTTHDGRAVVTFRKSDAKVHLMVENQPGGAF